jgi:hypothetical protein
MAPKKKGPKAKAKGHPAATKKSKKGFLDIVQEHGVDVVAEGECDDAEMLMPAFDNGDWSIRKEVKRIIKRKLSWIDEVSFKASRNKEGFSPEQVLMKAVMERNICGALRCSVFLGGAVWSCVVLCGAVWCCVVLCGAV